MRTRDPWQARLPRVMGLAVWNGLSFDVDSSLYLVAKSVRLVSLERTISKPLFMK